MENSKLVLVTGGSGFVALHCIRELLEKGYRVRTTLRTIERKEEVLNSISNSGIEIENRLSFIQTDLLKDDNWEVAARDCAYVLHVASPMIGNPKDESEIIRPAVEGTLRVLNAACKAGVSRVVLTSNFGAVGYSHTDPDTIITENEWTNVDQPGLPAYHRSKILAERAAWDFVKNNDTAPELAVINPVFILGPSLGPDFSGSFTVLEHLLSGAMKPDPALNFNIVDVRDVADLHVRAMENPAAAGERFLALAGGYISALQIAELLQFKFPGIAKMILPAEQGSDALVKKVIRNVSNQKAKAVLGWQPVATNEEAIIASVESMITFGKIA